MRAPASVDRKLSAVTGSTPAGSRQPATRGNIGVQARRPEGPTTDSVTRPSA